MKVASIVPTPLLSLTKDNDYNMCLYHVVKENPRYAEFFRKQAEEGKFVIMDNGAAEGVNPSIEDLMEIYPLVNPTEIVLPDVVYNKEETLSRTREAYRKLTAFNLDLQYQFMAVPQGNNFAEWLECMREMIRQTHISTLGVSKFVTPKFQGEMGAGVNVRLECVDAIINEALNLNKDIQIHLLGCWANPKEIGDITECFKDRVRGTDSCMPYVFARAGQLYEGQNRPDNHEIDFHNGTTNEKLLTDNIIVWERMCTNM